jgi:hypothetical protein
MNRKNHVVSAVSPSNNGRTLMFEGAAMQPIKKTFASMFPLEKLAKLALAN